MTNKETIKVEEVTNLTNEEVTYIEDVIKANAADVESVMNLCADCDCGFEFEEEAEADNGFVADNEYKSEVWYEVFRETLKDFCSGKVNYRKVEEYLFAFYKEDVDHPIGTMCDVFDHLKAKNIYTYA